MCWRTGTRLNELACGNIGNTQNKEVVITKRVMTIMVMIIMMPIILIMLTRILIMIIMIAEY